MSEKKNEFRDWMDDRRLKAANVCKPMQVSEQTIHQWRSYGVPARRAPHVKRFMSEWVDPTYAIPASIDDTNIVRVPFKDDKMDIVSEASSIVGTPMRDFIRKACIHKAREILADPTAVE